MDVRNGLLMNVLHHRAFDGGYMGIDEDCRVMFSPRIHDMYGRDDVSKLFEPFEGKKIDIASRISPGVEYLEFHRKHCFMES